MMYLQYIYVLSVHELHTMAMANDDDLQAQYKSLSGLEEEIGDHHPWAFCSHKVLNMLPNFATFRWRR